jgi:hypothetical protein
MSTLEIENRRKFRDQTMKSHQPEVFGTTLEKTNRWVNQISDLLHWDDHHKANHGLRAVLHVLRDRLPAPEAAHLGAQRPIFSLGIARAFPRAKTCRSFRPGMTASSPIMVADRGSPRAHGLQDTSTQGLHLGLGRLSKSPM